MKTRPWNYIGTGRATIMNPVTEQVEERRYYIRETSLAYAFVEDGNLYLGDRTPLADRRNAIRDALAAFQHQKNSQKTVTSAPITRSTRVEDEQAEKLAAE